jgi:hypothetical protein
MLVKKLGLLVVMLLVLVSVSMRASASRSCSGDDCGCYIYAQECRDSCAGNLTCVRACTRESVQCAKACCSCF